MFIIKWKYFERNDAIREVLEWEEEPYSGTFLYLSVGVDAGCEQRAVKLLAHQGLAGK